MKKHIALAIAAVLSLALVAPVFAQPFADVPAEHWAFDAIAELAAKGILEGYPDGTFKGDRAMTRYEMAMALARILARIEAIKIPPPPKIPPPEVRRADIDRLQRLINEFRAELSALGVRITALEEELAALRARLDNVKVTGDIRFRYNIFLPLFGTPDAPAFQPTPTTNVQNRFRLTFTGQVTPGISAVLRLNTFNMLMLTGVVGLAFVDRAYLDANLYGASWRVGKFAYTLSPIGASGYGLLFDPANILDVNDGILVRYSVAGFNLEGGMFRGAPFTSCVSTPAAQAACAKDYWTGRASTVIAGWTFALSGLSQRRPWYAGFPGNDTGWSIDAQGTLIPGVLTGGAAWASFRSQVAADFGIDPNSSAWTAWASITPPGVPTAPRLDVWYKNYGGFDSVAGVPKLGPDLSVAGTEFFFCSPLFGCNGFIGAGVWNFKGWGAQLTVQLTPKLSGSALWESGVNQWPSTSGLYSKYSEVFINFNYTLAARTTLTANYRRAMENFPNAPFDFGKTANQYRLQLFHSF